MFKTPLMREEVEQTAALFTVTETQLGQRPLRHVDNGIDAPFRIIPAEQFRGLVRLKRNQHGASIPRTLNIVSGTYNLVQNVELYTHIENEIIQRIHSDQLRDVNIIDRGAQHGRTTWREYHFPSIARRIGNSDHQTNLGFRVVVKNGYGGSALHLYYGAIDFFCTNGVICGTFTSEYRRHTKGLEIAGLAKGLDDALLQFDVMASKLSSWANVKVTNQQAMNLLRAIASSPRQFEKLNEQWLEERENRGDNKFALYSALTYYSSHSEGNFKVRENEEHDSFANVMHERELRVASWAEHKEFKELVGA